MKGGLRTGASIICNGCFKVDGDIFYRSEGSYGGIAYCYACTKRRLPVGWEPEVVCLPLASGFVDHIEEAYKRSMDKEHQDNLKAIAG